MEIEQRSLADDVHVVELNGALNARSAEDTKQVFRDLADKGAKQIIVDLSGVPFIDSSGLAALVSGLKTLGGDANNLKLAAPQSQARLLFELTMFDRVFQIYDSIEDAQASNTAEAS
ncbi:MAG: STAS domain-containing protein [Anaerolineae bacterium]